MALCRGHRRCQILQLCLLSLLSLFLTATSILLYAPRMLLPGTVPMLGGYVSSFWHATTPPDPGGCPHPAQESDKGFASSHLVTVSVAGRLGNWMFQHAALLAVARCLGYQAVLPSFSPLSGTFLLPDFHRAVFIANKTAYKHCKAGVYCDDVFSLPRDRNYSLEGFFQSWRYFHHASDLIRKNFRFLPSIEEPANRTLATLNPSGKVKVGVHVRRGDFTSKTVRERGFALATDGYLLRAMETFRSKFQDVVFVVVSDDINWCQKTLNKHNDTVFVRAFGRASEDLAVLAGCDHTIITSGTFGWWGAWLAGGETIYFRDYPEPNSSLAAEYKASDYYPPTWIPGS